MFSCKYLTVRFAQCRLERLFVPWRDRIYSEATDTLETGVTTQLHAAEAGVQIHSAALHKELGITDLVLAQILMVMVPEFFGTAVKAGSSSGALWILAILVFFIPQALVVAHLNQLMPIEGGLYEWARIAFNDRVGFLVAWNIWLSFILQVSQIALVTTTYVSYAAGPQADWIASNKSVVLVASVGLIAALIYVARLGLGVGKWVSNAGSVITVVTLLGLVVLPLIHLWRGSLSGYRPLRMVMPPLTLFSLSVFSKMTFGALSGFEYVAIFAGECRNPARHLAWSVFIAAPIIAVLYIFGTSSILAFVSPDAVDIIGPVPQALSLGVQSFGLARIIAPVAILLLLANYLCSYTLYVSGSARLPMVAGWDHLVPRWFVCLHAKHRTPVNSILFVGGVALAASIAVLIGVSQQEAFAQLQIWTWGFYGLGYLVMFAIPLCARKELGIRPALGLRIASVSGLLVTLLFVLLSVSPIISVESGWEYTTKTVAVIVGANLVGGVLYSLGRRRRGKPTEDSQ
jgi:amino acid transporter